MKSKFFAQPNLLADRRVVGEYFQEQIVPGSIGAELLMWLDDGGRRAVLEQEFERLHVETQTGCERARRTGDHGVGASGSLAGGGAWVRLRIAGVDEAGRGPLAGPVVAAAVILRPGRAISGIADSKELERPGAR